MTANIGDKTIQFTIKFSDGSLPFHLPYIDFHDATFSETVKLINLYPVAWRN